jgi:metal-sulfur cluster biosynthetic enzyme
MTTTTRGCPATGYLAYGARDSASGVPDIESVDFTLTYEPPWTPEIISPEAKQHLGVSDRDGW